MFYDSKFNGVISKFNVANVTDMSGIFYNSQFDGKISKWKFNKKVKFKDLGLSDKALKHMELRKQIGRFADMI